MKFDRIVNSLYSQEVVLKFWDNLFLSDWGRLNEDRGVIRAYLKFDRF